MKKILFILCLIAISCSKDDNTPPSIINPIVGTWKPIKLVGLCSTVGQQVFSILDDCTKESRWVFAQDDPTIDTDGTVKVISNSLTETGICEVQSTEEGTWLREGDVLKMTFGNLTDRYTYYEVFTHLLRIGYQAGGGRSSLCDDSTVLTHEYVEFRRVTEEE